MVEKSHLLESFRLQRDTQKDLKKSPTMNKKQAKFERLSYCEVYSKDKYATFRSKKQQTQLHQYSPAPVEINIFFYRWNGSVIDCFY